jgi:hypothetical protein
MAGLLDEYRLQPNLPGAMGQTPMPDMSALNQADNLGRLNQLANQPAPPQPPQTLGSRAMGILGAIGGGIKSRVQDPNFRDKLVIGLGGMTMNPNEVLMQQAAANIENRRKTDLISAEANKTIQYLRSKGREDLAKMVESQPSTARAVLEEYLKAEIRPGAGLKTSAVMTDPNSGEQYVVATDPNTGRVYRENVPGATALTPTQELEMESAAALKEQDIQQAMNAGTKAFGQVESIDAQIDKLYEALGAVRDGAESGFIRQFLPSFDAATAQLRAMGNALGIDIINSATFGALSAPELRLALSTGLDLSLSGKQLEDHIAAKIRAQTKLRNALYEKSRELTTGIGYSEFIQKNRVVPLAPPPGVDPLTWRDMLPEDKQEFMEAGN